MSGVRVDSCQMYSQCDNSRHSEQVLCDLMGARFESDFLCYMLCVSVASVCMVLCCDEKICMYDLSAVCNHCCISAFFFSTLSTSFSVLPGMNSIPTHSLIHQICFRFK